MDVSLVYRHAPVMYAASSSPILHRHAYTRVHHPSTSAIVPPERMPARETHWLRAGIVLCKATALGAPRGVGIGGVRHGLRIPRHAGASPGSPSSSFRQPSPVMW